MIVCVTSTGDSIKSELDPRFGRCAYFAFYDTDTEAFSIMENEAVRSGGGAGISSGQLMAEKKVNTVITGNVGPNAMSVLSTAGMEILRGVQSTIEDNIERFKAGKLDKISSTVPPHSGMKSRGGM